MPQRRSSHIVGFYDVSILLPVVGSQHRFLQALDSSLPFFRQNGIEVIVIAENDSAEIRGLPDSFPLINWKLVLHQKDPGSGGGIATLLNTGLSYAEHRYILWTHPHSCLKTDLIYRLRYILYHYANCFAVTDSTGSDLPGMRGRIPANEMALAEKQGLLKIGGFQHGNGYADCNIRTQESLEREDLKKMVVAEEGFQLLPEERTVCTTAENAAATIGGPAACALLFNWTAEKSPALYSLTPGRFKKHFLRDPADLSRHFRLICLMQTKNESRNIPDALFHAADICDGIILLDDDSTDGSYEIAENPKVLLKVQKTGEEKFNDLENRNQLLQLAHLFRSDWFIFLDADERPAFRRSDIDPILDMPAVDTVSFRLVHIWDQENKYRKDLPEGRDGILRRYRLFRNKGFMQITADRDLHFCVTPFRREKLKSSLLLLHYGLMDANVRKNKRQRYMAQDADGKKQGYAYHYLTDVNPVLADLETLIAADGSP